jgi:hypothetical protein
VEAPGFSPANQRWKKKGLQAWAKSTGAEAPQLKRALFIGLKPDASTLNPLIGKSAHRAKA